MKLFEIWNISGLQLAKFYVFVMRTFTIITMSKQVILFVQKCDTVCESQTLS